MPSSQPPLSDCDGVSADSMRQELYRILASPIFHRSARLSAFLQYVVEQSLAGKGETLKEQVLAIELYKRDGDLIRGSIQSCG